MRPDQPLHRNRDHGQNEQQQYNRGNIHRPMLVATQAGRAETSRCATPVDPIESTIRRPIFGSTTPAMGRVAIICLRVVIGAMALLVAQLNSVAAMMIAMFHVFLGPFISMARDFSADQGNAVPPAGQKLPPAEARFHPRCCDWHVRLRRGTSLQAPLARCRYRHLRCRLPPSVARGGGVGDNLICLTRGEATRLNRPS